MKKMFNENYMGSPLKTCVVKIIICFTWEYVGPPKFVSGVSVVYTCMQ